VPVLADAPSNAVAVTIGAAVGAPGVLVQCAVEEAMELRWACAAGLYARR
jgi:propanediol dehydratase large subunit